MRVLSLMRATSVRNSTSLASWLTTKVTLRFRGREITHQSLGMDLLNRIRDAVHQGEKDYARLEREAAAELDRHGWKTDYIAVRRQADLLPPTGGNEALVVLGASRLGMPRLIDNVEI